MEKNPAYQAEQMAESHIAYLAGSKHNWMIVEVIGRHEVIVGISEEFAKDHATYLNDPSEKRAAAMSKGFDVSIEAVRNMLPKLVDDKAMEHTPTPLIVAKVIQDGEEYYFPLCYGQKNVFDGRYVNIAALVPTLNPSDRKYQDRADFIVRAVNRDHLFDELVWAVRAVLCDPEGKACFVGSDGDRAVIDNILAKIEKVKP